MPEVKVLIVENDENDIQIYQDTINVLNTQNETKIIPKICKTKENGMEELSSKSDWGAAFIDIKLSTGNILNATEGNDIIREIYGKKRFPVFVLTNTPSYVDSSFKQSIFLRVSSKTDIDYPSVFSEILKINETGILNILGKRGKLENYLDDIFWKHISTVLPEFIAENIRTGVDIEKILLRYISSHLSEYLEIVSNGLESADKIEYYIKPPIKPIIFTGDIIKTLSDNSYSVILTPACDLATDEHRTIPKAQFVTLAKINPLCSVTNGKNTNEIKKLKNNSLDLKYHYLPQTSLFVGGFINFQEMRSVPISEFSDQSHKVECVITSPFRKDIVSRFSQYYSRQGQPVLNH